MAYSQPMSRRRRATALGLTIAIHVLVALVIWNLPPTIFFRPTSDTLATFDVAPDAGDAPQAAPAPKAERRPERAEQRPTPPQKPPPPPEPELKLPVPDFMRMTRDQFAATDLSRLPKSAPRAAVGGDDDAPSAGAAGSTSAGAGDSPSVAGAGPGGARLFRAEWVREPTDAELRTYMPTTPYGSWGEIVCRMIANNRVENCQTLGESPRGSGLATGLRRASWQFLIRPPRIDGKPILGTWVCIHFDFANRHTDRCISQR